MGLSRSILEMQYTKIDYYESFNGIYSKMLYHSTLLLFGLTLKDIKTLEKDGSIQDHEHLRDLIMSLHFNAKQSEKKINDLWNVIGFIKEQSVIMSISAFALGVSLTVIVYNM